MTRRSNLTAAERSLHASLAANTRWAAADRKVESEKARSRQMERFEREVDPDGVLSPAERSRRAENARRAHMARLSMKAAAARRAKREAAA